MAWYWWMIVGVAIGWITKVPFLTKWYNELRETKEYKAMMHEKKIKRRMKELGYGDDPAKW